MQKHILITGATGFIGKWLTRALVERGHHCRCLVRDISRLNGLQDLQVEVERGDLLDSAVLDSAVQDVDTIYHLAAQGHVSATSKEAEKRFFKVNVEGSRMLVERAAHAGVRRFIHFSSTAAMGLPGQGSYIDETEQCNAKTPYQQSKYGSENVVLEVGRHSQMEVIVLRPCMVYGPGATDQFLKLCKLAKKGLFWQLGRNPSLMPMVHVSDVVQAAVLALEKGAGGRIYLIASDWSESTDDIRRLILRSLGVQRPHIVLPAALAKHGAFLFETIARLLGVEPPITRNNIESTMANRVFSVEKAKVELGYVPHVSIDKGISETVAWYRRHRYL